MARRRSSAGPALWLVLSALVVGAGVLVWVALSVADFREPVAGDPDVAAGVDPSRPPTVDEPAPSGWAPPELVAPEPGFVDLTATTAAELAPAVLDQVVARAPVVVTVDGIEEPQFGAASALARDLDAPLLVVAATSSAGAEPASPTVTAAPDSVTSPGAATSTRPGEDATGAATEAPASAAATTAAATTAPDSAALLDRWGTSQVVAVGTPPTTSATVHQVTVEVPASTAGASADPAATQAASEAASGAVSGAPAPEPIVTRPEQVEAMLADARAIGAGDGLGDVVAVVRPGDDGMPQPLAQALEFASIDTAAFAGDDPRGDADLQAALAGVPTTLLAVADDQWPSLPMSVGEPDWPGLFTSAVQAPELIGGGKVLFPDKTFIAAYGNPRGPALGVLGERDLEGSIDYAKGLAADYDGLFGDSQVLPAFEVIVTVASGDAEADGSYSRKEDLDLVTEWVDGATSAGLYVVLDLQPGREDFLTQAKRLEDLLRRPNVGLAMDPEWRLGADQVHLSQIGTVTTAEVNQVSEWLAGIVREEVLPEKLLIIHNFRLSMLTNREDLVFPPELATMVHVDGQGPQTLKNDTYKVLTDAGPDQLWWGWKNFYDEDSPETRSPQDTAAIEPTPHFISYQ